MAAMTDIKLIFINTWTTKPVHKALPHEHNPGLKVAEYACWRSHADAWRKVIEEGWATAMILEDDADWDGGIHESMALAWDALIEITNDASAQIQANSLVHSTLWSDERWDIFYTGSCMDLPGTNHVLINDPHLPKTSTWWIDHIYSSYFGGSTKMRRLIQPSVEPVCTHSYIISQTGARKLLFHTNRFLPWGVDVAIIKLMNKGTISGYTIIPPLFVRCLPPQWLTLESMA
jgi:GR25 family glycosyltransferase involved in LPS biosynthesis